MMTEQVATVWRWWPRSTLLKHLVFQPTLGIHFLNRYLEIVDWKRILLSTPKQTWKKPLLLRFSTKLCSNRGKKHILNSPSYTWSICHFFSHWFRKIVHFPCLQPSPSPSYYDVPAKERIGCTKPKIVTRQSDKK